MPPFSFARWRPRHLLLSWIAYWFVLGLVTVGPAIPAIWRATRGDAHGEVSANFGDARLSLTVKEAGQTTWQGSVRLLTLALWVALPPLVLWVLWLAARPRARYSDEAEMIRAKHG